jgi:hypothetical protein
LPNVTEELKAIPHASKDLETLEKVAASRLKIFGVYLMKNLLLFRQKWRDRWTGHLVPPVRIAGTKIAVRKTWQQPWRALKEAQRDNIVAVLRGGIAGQDRP